MKAVIGAASLALWSLFVWQSAHAWGDEGHRITGHVASALLTDTTRQQLRMLLGTDDLADIATWMDDERDALNQRLPGSAKWHYENRTACADVSQKNTCPKGHCVTQQIERSSRVLANRSATNAQRAEAVRILVHLLGDLHQPLHLIDNHDRGGNDVYVRLPREQEARRLHEVWDTRLVRMNLRRRDTTDYADALMNRFASERAAWQRGNVEQWANETHTLALQHAYQPLPGFTCRSGKESDSTVQVVSTAYLEAAKPVVDSQLVKAGYRIAVVLNSVTSTPAKR